MQLNHLLRAEKAHYIGCIVFAVFAIITYFMYQNVTVDKQIYTERKAEETDDICESLAKDNSSFVQYLTELDKIQHTPEKREIEFWYKHRTTIDEDLVQCDTSSNS